MNDRDRNVSDDAPGPTRSGALSRRRMPFDLILFVVGSTARSGKAIENTRRICEQWLAGRYTLRIVDLYLEPAAARTYQVLAAPTLLKRAPDPERRLIGDMSDEPRVLHGLGLRPAAVI